MGETVRGLELEVEPEVMIDLLQPHDKISIDEGLLVMDEQRKWFLELKLTPGEDAVKIIEMTTKDLAGKAVAGFERIDSSLERSSVSKMLSNSVHATEKSFMKGKVN